MRRLTWLLAVGTAAELLCLAAIGGCDSDDSAERPPSPDASTTPTGSEPDAGSDAGDGGAGGGVDAGPDASCPEGYGGPPATSEPPISGSWTLEFQDDFLEAVVDDDQWKVGAHWAGFNGIAANGSENISLRCGYLTMLAEKRSVQFAGDDLEYVAGELSTFKRFRQLYGYMEARIRYDAIQGLWPAFWLMPDRGNYGNVDQNRMTYLKFDLSDDSRTSVQSATIELHVTSAEAGVQNVSLMRVPDDGWSESTITFANRPKVDPLWIEMRYDPGWSAGDTASFDVTEYVSRELAGDKVVSFALVDGFMRARRVSFASKQSANAAERPKLVLSGSPAEVLVAEDASVGEGSSATQNLGAEAVLHVEEEWGNTASTYDGGMEVDIMESLGHWGDDMTQHALHWDGYGADHQHEGSGHLSFPPTSDGFHVYGLNWQPGLVEFYVDGSKTFEWTNARVGSVASFIHLSLQMGGWADALGDNRTPDDAALPGEMVVDYVRVWSGAPD
ncbi:MAG: family 16 glycosylhydrolase [Deltaproteobacteria bacterium]|jgi:beta-glucanase (GH16 family)|nr:family 16 glycosylhydrolase [Deltaproteobacteria bacterium]MBW2536298.1 family 16 glycosylhydrolase [Deltaproteobacteria bacterium]